MNNTIEKYAESEKHHWWHRARRHIIFTLLDKYSSQNHGIEPSPRPSPLRRGRKVLDVGCGPGTTMSHLERFGQVMGIDISPDAVKFCRDSGHKYTVCASAEKLPIKDEEFSMITMLDVLEHIEDDMQVLHELARICKPNGIILLAVPAYRFLLWYIDEICRHKRRYTASELCAKLMAVGLHIEKVSYMNALLLPVTWLSRRWKAMTGKNKPLKSPFEKNYPSWLSHILESLFKLEVSFLKIWDLPFGVSIICVARKQ